MTPLSESSQYHDPPRHCQPMSRRPVPSTNYHAPSHTQPGPTRRAPDDVACHKAPSDVANVPVAMRPLSESQYHDPLSRIHLFLEATALFSNQYHVPSKNYHPESDFKLPSES